MQDAMLTACVSMFAALDDFVAVYPSLRPDESGTQEGLQEYLARQIVEKPALSPGAPGKGGVNYMLGGSNAMPRINTSLGPGCSDDGQPATTQIRAGNNITMNFRRGRIVVICSSPRT